VRHRGRATAVLETLREQSRAGHERSVVAKLAPRADLVQRGHDIEVELRG